jgi:glycosyltransferase involved in cell wall biosynthesis
MKGTVTIAIPVYNGEKYIAEALQSIVNQSVKVDQITICDNCSTDGTMEIAGKFKKDHPDFNVDIVRNDSNLGYQRNFNKCMELAKTDYVLLLAADDLLKKEIVEVESNFLDEHPDFAFVATYSDGIGPDGELIHRHKPKEDQLFEKGQILEFLERNRLYIVPSAVMLRTRCIRETGYWDLHIGPDERYWPKLLQKYSIAILGTALVKRREHPGQTAVKDYKTKYAEVISSLKENLTVAELENTPGRRSRTLELISNQNSSSSMMMGNLVIKQYDDLWTGLKYFLYSVNQAPTMKRKKEQMVKATKILLYGLSHTFRQRKLNQRSA